MPSFKSFSSRRIALALIAAPLALAISACDSGDDAATEGTSADAIAEIAAPAGTQWSDTVAVTDVGGYRMGNPDAPIKLVEYAALSCPHCAEFSAEASEEIREEFVNTGRVSYELRFFPLQGYDLPSTLLATCSAPEATIALADQMWANQRSFFEKAQAAPEGAFEQVGQMPPEQRFVAMGELFGLTDFVAARGISRDQANACLADSAKAQAIAEQGRAAVDRDGISGTPTFLLNGTKLEAMPWAELKAKLEAAGSR